MLMLFFQDSGWIKDCSIGIVDRIEDSNTAVILIETEKKELQFNNDDLKFQEGEVIYVQPLLGEKCMRRSCLHGVLFDGC